MRRKWWELLTMHRPGRRSCWSCSRCARPRSGPGRLVLVPRVPAAPASRLAQRPGHQKRVPAACDRLAERRRCSPRSAEDATPHQRGCEEHRSSRRVERSGKKPAHPAGPPCTTVHRHGRRPLRAYPAATSCATAKAGPGRRARPVWLVQGPARVTPAVLPLPQRRLPRLQTAEPTPANCSSTPKRDDLITVFACCSPPTSRSSGCTSPAPAELNRGRLPGTATPPRRSSAGRCRRPDRVVPARLRARRGPQPVSRTRTTGAAGGVAGLMALSLDRADAWAE